ncbi:MAG TPA: sn-glycerol-3-phosphate ABC transporter ATP-binding protein UgpC [Actinomycetota bacterium]|nr:sn-glycerol-3-phosphate ABC transporter ATP-binding protein UgpC [Actinomycetota bacterium]
MATVTVERVSKVYPNGLKAVSELSLEMEDGEFLVLVGPSGCGKTTALRMVAGLEDITEGTIRIGDRVVNDLTPQDRDIAMVFQNYALYPHMTVAENIGFSLKLHHTPKAEVAQRVGEVAKILGLEEHLSRKPAQLSGGQRQRVAMGRAIVRQPAVFLMDEPLSNLDAKLRVQMRAEVARLQRRLNVSTLYVTHDQTEAMTMGDRVAVLKDGVLQQLGQPQQIYTHPANLFVAGFIGSPAMNIYEAALSESGDEIKLGSQSLTLPPSWATSEPLAAYRGKKVVAGIRPEDLPDAAQPGRPAGGQQLVGQVELVEELGSEKFVHFRIDAARVHAHAAAPAEDMGALAQGEIGAAVLSEGVARVAPSSTVKAGDQASFILDVERLYLFDEDTTEAIRGPGALSPGRGLKPDPHAA